MLIEDSFTSTLGEIVIVHAKKLHHEKDYSYLCHNTQNRKEHLRFLDDAYVVYVCTLYMCSQNIFCNHTNCRVLSEELYTHRIHLINAEKLTSEFGYIVYLVYCTRCLELPI